MIRHLAILTPTLLSIAAFGADEWTIPANGSGVLRSITKPGGVTVNVRDSGFGSAMARVPGTTNQFWLLTDRGPNADGASGSKIAPVPTFTPRIGKFQLNADGTVTPLGVVELYRADGTTKLTGMPIPSGTGATSETFYAMNADGTADTTTTYTDTQGLDSEGLVALADGTFWISDEYGPFLAHFDANGKQLERIDGGAPNGSGHKLPQVLVKRVPNKGMEGLTITPDGKTLIGMMQATLTTTGSFTGSDEKANLAVRILAYNLAAGTSKQYIYLLDDAGSTKAAGAVSEIAAISSTRFLVLERDGKFAADPSKLKKVYLIDLSAATDVSDPSDGADGKLYGGKTVEAVAFGSAGQNNANAKAALIAAGITPVTKTLVLDIQSEVNGGTSTTAPTVLPGKYPHDKVEGMALVGQTLYLSNDDDFGMTSDSTPSIITKTITGSGGTQDYQHVLAVDLSAKTDGSGGAVIPKPTVGALRITWSPVLGKAYGVLSASDPKGNAISGFTIASAPASGTATVTSSGAVTFTATGFSGTTTFTVTATDAAGTVSAPATVTVAMPDNSPYIVPVATGVQTRSIFTVGNAVNTKADGTPYRMAGIPDGLGLFSNNDGTFTLLMNHELVSSEGVTRGHGSKGAFVSRWTIDTSSLNVLNIQDQDSAIYSWNGSAYVAGTTAFTRFCSGDLAPASGLLNGTKGTAARIYFDGEESSGGRAVAHIVSGSGNGNAYELPRMGKAAWENLLVNPKAQDKTIVIGQDDQSLLSGGAASGQVYCYIGSKLTTGSGANEIADAGLSNGKLYGISVSGFTSEGRTSPFGIGKDQGKPFTLVALGSNGDVSALDGTALDSDSDAKGATRFLRPEDGAWDPSNPADFYFNTTDRIDDLKNGGTGVATPQTGRSRLWRLRFNDISTPENGGTITLLIDGSEDPGPQMLDNLTVDGQGRVILNEDPGAFVGAGRTWVYSTTSGSLTPITRHDPAKFGDRVAGVTTLPTAPFTNDEETSGVIDASAVLGTGWSLMVSQAHYLNNDAETVEGGQLLALYVPPLSQLTSLPTISTPADQALAVNTASTTIPVTIGDAQTPANRLTLSAASGNPSLLPASGIALGGSGTARTVTITPASGMTGSAVVTLTVSDGDGGTASSAFTVTVSGVSAAEAAAKSAAEQQAAADKAAADQKAAADKAAAQQAAYNAGADSVDTRKCGLGSGLGLLAAGLLAAFSLRRNR